MNSTRSFYFPRIIKTPNNRIFISSWFINENTANGKFSSSCVWNSFPIFICNTKKHRFISLILVYYSARNDVPVNLQPYCWTNLSSKIFLEIRILFRTTNYPLLNLSFFTTLPRNRLSNKRRATFIKFWEFFPRPRSY